MDLLSYVTLENASSKLAFPSFYTLDRQKVDYRSLCRLPTPYAPVDIFRSLQAVKTEFHTHTTKAGIPLLLPHARDGSITNFDFVELNPTANYQELIYDFQQKRIMPSSLLRWHRLPVDDEIKLSHDLVIGPHAKGLSTSLDNLSDGIQLEIELRKKLVREKNYHSYVKINFVVLPTSMIASVHLRYWLLPSGKSKEEEMFDAAFTIARVGTTTAELSGQARVVDITTGERGDFQYVYDGAVYEDASQFTKIREIDPIESLQELCQEMLQPKVGTTLNILAGLDYL